MRLAAACRLLPCLVLAAVRVASGATPQSVELLPSPGVGVARDDVFTVYAGFLGLRADDRLELTLERPSLTKGRTVAFYRQTYRGLPVEGGTFSLSLRDGELASGVGRVITGL